MKGCGRRKESNISYERRVCDMNNRGKKKKLRKTENEIKLGMENGRGKKKKREMSVV